ncbi:MAG TPA: hypothetical protein VK527_04430 [Candidatus Limnocylindrales bacterium]|nr:hypothetical protein [Candidatus Limnocylindrales bacterium]
MTRSSILFSSLWLVSTIAAPALAQSPVSSAAPQDSTLEGRLREFVSCCEGGVPYGTAHAFGPKALPILAQMLNDEAYRKHWTWIVTTIGFVGGDESFEILHTFLLDRFSGEVGDAVGALAGTVSVMGMTRAPKAERFLIERVNPDAWKDVRWSFSPHQPASLHVLLSRAAINGLSYLGNERAANVLAELEKRPYASTQMANIKEGIRRNLEVGSKGWDEYVRGISNR